METIHIENIKEVKRNIRELQEKLNIKIDIIGKKVNFSGDGLEEYEAMLVFEAIKFGFSVKNALLLLNPELDFRIMNIKDFSRKKNMKEVRGRVIGKQGKTLRTMENISGAEIILKENEIGVIGDAEQIEETITAIQNLVKGTKQSNVYRYMEKTNTRNKKSDGLGLKQ